MRSSYKDYAQALEFDQLKALMKEGTVLNGFNEGLINFPPTFKYDVLRTSKRSKQPTPKLNRLDRAGSRSARFTEIEHRDMEETEEEDAEGVSLLSSMATSFNSRSNTEPGIQGNNSHVRLTAISSNKPSTTLNIVGKAKAKLITLLSPSFATRSSKSPERKQGEIVSPHSPSPRIFHTGLSSSDPTFHIIPNARRRFVRPSPLNLASPASSGYTNEEEPDKGVYDSSHKRRVPSW